MSTVDSGTRAYTPFAALQACLEIVIGSKDVQDVCRRIVHSKLFSQTTIGAWIFRVQDGISLVEIAGYGKPIEDGLNELPMWDENPASMSIQRQRYVFQAGSEDASQAALGAIPVIADGIPVAACILVMRPETLESPVSPEVLESLGTLVSSFCTPRSEGKVSNQTQLGSPTDLTSRQIIILGHMSDGLTNLEISSKVLLSESTVRQETIRIYRALGVSNRTEAVAAARKLNLIPSLI